MRIAEINMMQSGSTGKIMFGIASCAKHVGTTVRTFSPRFYYKRHQKAPTPKATDHAYFGIAEENLLHKVIAMVCGSENYGSLFGTLQLIQALRTFEPDIIHLHNLHNYTIHLPLLFRYLKRSGAHVIWTLHDCWAMTGRCSHFTMAKCEKWKTGCNHCPQVHDYPRYYIDQTKHQWRMKCRLFTSLTDMVLVTPSQWLADLTKQSFLRTLDVRVINNGIDLSTFQPVESDFRKVHNIPYDKPILLGVAFDWGQRKGLDVFCKLAEDLDDAYQIVLVGTDDHIDMQLPSSIISIHRTQNQHELAEIYSAADVFLNPTREDTFPTVNIESLTCGTPVITFATGGSPEILDETCGIVVPCDDVPALEKAIHYVIQDKPFSREACRKRAERFDMKDKFAEYVSLYHELCEDKQ